MFPLCLFYSLSFICYPPFLVSFVIRSCYLSSVFLTFVLTRFCFLLRRISSLSGYSCVLSCLLIVFLFAIFYFISVASLFSSFLFLHSTICLYYAWFFQHFLFFSFFHFLIFTIISKLAFHFPTSVISVPFLFPSSFYLFILLLSSRIPFHSPICFISFFIFFCFTSFTPFLFSLNFLYSDWFLFFCSPFCAFLLLLFPLFPFIVDLFLIFLSCLLIHVFCSFHFLLHFRLLRLVFVLLFWSTVQCFGFLCSYSLSYPFRWFLILPWFICFIFLSWLHCLSFFRFLSYPLFLHFFCSSSSIPLGFLLHCFSDFLINYYLMPFDVLLSLGG